MPPQPRTLFLRSVEDPAIPNHPSTPPFETPNLYLGATVWAAGTRATDGEVEEDRRQVGTAAACGVITDPTFAVGGQVPFYVEFDLEDGRYAATGSCTVLANQVPEAGVILAACSLTVADESGTPRGIATSASVFNPRRLPGYATGSFWTLHLY